MDDKDKEKNKPDSSQLVNVSIPTQLKKSQKRKHIRTEFDDGTLDASAVDAQRREKERLERLEKVRQQQSVDHIAEYEKLLFNSGDQNDPLPQLDINFSDFYDSESMDFDNIEIKSENQGQGFAQASSSNQPSTSRGNFVNEVIDVSSDSETDDVQFIATTPSTYRINKSSPRKGRYYNGVKDREDYEQMEEQYVKEQQRIKKMRDLKELESTEKCGGRLLVNAGHPEEDPDIFVTPHLTHVLQPHQLGGIRFMYDNTIESLADYKSTPGFGCILAHSMGLGKTIQVITFSEIFFRATKAKKIMIIVPINTIQNWYAEYDKWMPKFSDTGERIRNFEVFLLGDSQKTFDQRVNCIEEWDKKGGCLLIGYDMFRLLIKTTKPKTEKKKRPKLNLNGASSSSCFLDQPSISTAKSEETETDSFYTASGRLRSEAHDLLRRALLDPGPELVVCDEGHKIKNLNTDISMSLASIKTTRRIVLTGYPLQNNLMEYYCMIDFVRPKYLGNKKSFQESFEKPIKNGQCVDSTEGDIKIAKQRTHVLVELVKGFVQRRTHHLLKSILPESREFVILLRKSSVQRLLYRNFVLYARNEIQSKSTNTFNPLKAFAACSKIWNHPDVLANMIDKMTSNDAESEKNSLMLNGGLMNYGFTQGNGTNPMKVKVEAASPSLQNMNTPTSSNGMSQMNYSQFNGNGSFLMANNPNNGFYPGIDYGNGQPADAKKKKGRPSKKTQQPNTSFANGDDFEEAEGTIKYDWSREVLAKYEKGNIENGFKMLVAMEILNGCTRLGEKILIFSQNLTALSLIEDYLSIRRVELKDGKGERWEKNRNYLRFDGSTTGADREKLINRFNTDKSLHLFLISTRAGSLGINLVSANRCIIFDACWNPCHDAQAVCRVYRYGQQRRTYIYRLIMDNSMEKAIFNRQISKHGLQQRVVDEAQVDANITQKELETLLVYDEALDVIHDKWDTSDWDLDDPLLTSLTQQFSHLLSQKPFLHESLILESETVLSEEEKKEAQLLFEREKRGEQALLLEDPRLEFRAEWEQQANSYSRHQPGFSYSNPFEGMNSGMVVADFVDTGNNNGHTFNNYFANRPASHHQNQRPQIRIPHHAMVPSPMPQSLKMNVPTYSGGGATMASSSNNRDNVPYHPQVRANHFNTHLHLPGFGQQFQKTGTGFEGAISSDPPSFNSSGFVQDLTTDRDLILPLVGERQKMVPIKAGTRVQLIRPNNGLYIKLPTGLILDAYSTIFSAHAEKLLQQRQRVLTAGSTGQTHAVNAEVIELD